MSGSTRVTGTRPLGTDTEQQAAHWVQQMFAGIAPRYDLINHLLSFNVDRLWRKRLRSALELVLRNPEARVLDLCCGTGDVLFELRRDAAASIYGADFCHAMLLAAHRKAENAKIAPLFIEADALRFPVHDETFDAIAISFGFRNLANYESGLVELYRMLRAGGVLAILEFSQPSGRLMKTAYAFYSRALMPAIGGLISGSREAYAYLPDSIRKFPSAPVLRDMMHSAGFVETRYQLLTGGIAALHVGFRRQTVGSLAS